MDFDSHLAALLDENIEYFYDKGYLNQLWMTWSKQRKESNLVSFRDFVFGTLNGSILSLYSSYNGKRATELESSEYDELRRLLITRYEGLERELQRFQAKNG
jgi:hypothetical protein